jgi:PAS domain S-box-containing protein
MARPAKVQVKESNRTKADLAAEVEALKDRVLELEASQSAQQKNEDQFRLILENSVQGILVHRHRKPLFANQAFADLYGYETPEEILALESSEVLISPAHTEARVHESRLMGEDIPRDAEIRGRRKDGSELWVGKHSFVIDWDGEPAVCSARFDVTEARTASDILKRIVESIPGGIAIYDKDDRLVLYNENFIKDRPEYVDILKPGRTFEEITRALEATNARDKYLGSERKALEERLQIHRDLTGPFEFKLSNGAVKQIHDFKMNDGGRAIIRTDITELRQVETALQQSEERFRTLSDSSIQGVNVHRNFKLLYVNQAFADIYGYETPEEVLAADPLLEMIPEEERELVQETCEKLLSGEIRNTDRKIVRTKIDGSKVVIHNRQFLIQWDGEPAICSLRFDITEQARTEQFLKSAMEAIPHGFALYDENDTLALINENFFKYRSELKNIMTPGISFEEQLLLREEQGLLHGIVDGKNITADERRERHKNPIGPYLGLSPDGQTLQIDEFKTSDGGTVIIRTDISELIEVETALRDSEERYRLFAGDIAHQLRTPLAILRANLDGMKRAGDFKSLVGDVDDMARLVGQLLAYAQLDSLNIAPSDQADLCEICTNVAAYIAPLAIQEGRSIEVLGAESPVFINGAVDALKQAMRNLVENAIKYSARGSTITLEVFPDCSVRVIDHGKGVQKDHREGIFTRFSKIDRRGGGAGLGLSIVQRIIDAHGGTIDLSDTPGGGATFTLQFLRGAEEVSQPRSAAE